MTFDVRQLDADPVSRSWGFWNAWAAGAWEPKTHATIDLFVDEGTFVDIGAWVGPTTLWAAPHASNILAVEPDPTAFAMLLHNLDVARLDHDLVQPARVAIADHDGTTTIDTSGTSMSRTGQGGEEVHCFTLESLFTELAVTNVDLIKIDIEGAEATVLPQAEPFLHHLRAPIHLSTHPWAPLDWEPLFRWKRVQLDNDEWLLIP